MNGRNIMRNILLLLALCIGLEEVSCQNCRNSLRVRDFVAEEKSNEADQHKISLDWTFPAGMSASEKFVLRVVSNENGQVLLKKSLSISDAGCTMDDACGQDLELSSFLGGGFHPCGAYSVGIEVSGLLRYCASQSPITVWRQVVLKEKAPEKPTKLTLVNFDDTFWTAELRWKVAEEDNCIQRFRVSFSAVNGPYPRPTVHHVLYTHLPLSHLGRCTDYQFRVSAITASGLESDVAQETFRTGGCFTIGENSPRVGSNANSTNSLPIVVFFYIFLILYARNLL